MRSSRPAVSLAHWNICLPKLTSEGLGVHAEHRSYDLKGHALLIGEGSIRDVSVC